MSSTATHRTEVIFLLFFTLAAFGVRLYHVGSISLAEDEAAKWLAMLQYEQGYLIGVSSGHPMRMRLLAWASLEVGKDWNRWAGPLGRLRECEEATLRFPDLLIGAPTPIVIHPPGKEMLGVAGAGAAAFFWAVMPLPAALSRILPARQLRRGAQTGKNELAGEGSDL